MAPLALKSQVYQGVACCLWDSEGNPRPGYAIANSTYELGFSKNPATPADFPVAKDGLPWTSISPDAHKLASVGRERSVDVYDRLSTQQRYNLTGHEQTLSFRL